MKIKYLLLAVPLFFCACDDEPQDTDQKPVAVNTHESIVLNVHQEMKDSLCLVTSSYSYYNKAGALIKTRITTDTVPVLEMVKDTLDTQRTYEDANGDDQEIDTVVVHRKHYQIFVGLK
jgi:hypothetical protein